jgi:hypothetical protein
MNRIVVLPLVFAATLAQAALTPSSFPLSRPLIPPSTVRSEIGAFIPDSEVYDTLDASMANLRLFDASNRETPFLIRRRAPTRLIDRLVPFADPLAVQSLREQADNRLELVVTRDPKLPRPAALEFATNVRNFEKLVTVRGTLDGEHWTELAREEPIYDYSRYADVRRYRIPLADGSATTYRIEISNITEKKDSPLVEMIRQTRGQKESNEIEATSFRREPFRIERLMFLERRQVADSGAVETDEVAIGKWSAVQDPVKQATVITFTARREPLCALLLVTDEANFSRRAVLEGRTDDPPETWQPVADDRLSRIRIGRVQEERLVLAFPAEARYHTYRLTLYNEDNPPLTVGGLLARRNLHEVLFFPKTGQSYRLCWGGTDVASPRYDIGAVLASVPAGSADLWSLGPTTRPSDAKVGRSWAFYSRKAMIVALVAMAGILMVVVIRLAGKVEMK